MWLVKVTVRDSNQNDNRLVKDQHFCEMTALQRMLERRTVKSSVGCKEPITIKSKRATNCDIQTKGATTP